MRRYSAKERRFISWVRKQCKLHGFKCDLRNTRYVKLSGNIRCSGYFDETERVLVVSMNRPDWIEILAHEYCHLTQFVEGCDVWRYGCIGIEKVDDWISGKTMRNIKKWIGWARDLELDNEKRTVDLIKRWGLKVDIPRYIKKANAYIQFYNYLYYIRRWSNPGNSPYGNENLIEAMPDTFRMKYSDMSKRIFKLFQTENI